MPTTQIDFESWLKAAKFSTRLEGRLQSFEENQKMYRRTVQQPLITALWSCPDPEVAYRLLEGGADPNTMSQVSYQILTDEWQRRYNKGETVLDIVRRYLDQLRKYTGESLSTKEPKLPEEHPRLPGSARGRDLPALVGFRRHQKQEEAA